MSFSSPEAFLGESSLEQYVKGVSTFPLHDEAREKVLFAELRRGEEGAFDEIVMANLRFVVDEALKYRNTGTSLKDLIQAGNRGLARAAVRYDPARGGRFLSYALWWIRQEILETMDSH